VSLQKLPWNGSFEVEAIQKKNKEAPVVVVTGASRGIGRAIALSLGKASCKVSSLLPIQKI